MITEVRRTVTEWICCMDSCCSTEQEAVTSAVFRFDADQVSPPATGRNTTRNSPGSEFTIYDVVV